MRSVSTRKDRIKEKRPFPNKAVPISCHCEAAARPWQSLSQRHGIPWRSMGVRNKKKSLSQKTWIHCVVLLPLSLFQGSVSFRAIIVRSGMANRFVKDCRVGRKNCALLAMTKSIGSIENTERKIQSLESVKTFLICCLILTVPVFFDSLKPQAPLFSKRGLRLICSYVCCAICDECSRLTSQLCIISLAAVSASRRRSASISRSCETKLSALRP